MKSISIIIAPEQEGEEILALLRKQALSTGLIRRLKRANGILLDGECRTVRTRVTAGQQLTLLLPETPSQNIQPVQIPLTIEYEDDDILIIDKPAGMPVHPSQGHYTDTLANAVVYYMGAAFTFRSITRLDRYTTGLVLIAKHAAAAADLCRQLQNGQIQKTYYAVTDGIPNPLSGTVTLPIARVPGSTIARACMDSGKPAVTEYEVIAINDGLALVRLYPKTGRTHQIRVHMAALGCPLLYDFLYGIEQPGKSFLLHCGALGFRHPMTGKQIRIEKQRNFQEIGLTFDYECDTVQERSPTDFKKGGIFLCQ